MRIESTARSAAPAARTAARGAASGFAMPAEMPAAAGQADAAPGATSLDMLLLLQEALPAGERRRRAVKRGRGLLSLLEELRLDLLSGAAPAALAGRLAALLAEQRETTDDRGLDAVLDAVELRAEVEVAKFAAAHTR
jgi:hypothetical protein